MALAKFCLVHLARHVVCGKNLGRLLAEMAGKHLLWKIQISRKMNYVGIYSKEEWVALIEAALAHHTAHHRMKEIHFAAELRAIRENVK